MRKVLSILFFCCISFLVKAQADLSVNSYFKKTKSGVLYHIITGSDSIRLTNGDIIKFNITAKVRDSFLVKPGTMPGYTQVDTTRDHYDFNDVTPLMHVGDSAVIGVPIDTLIAKGMLQPGFAGSVKGDILKFYIRIQKSFKNQDDAKVDFEAENKIMGDASLKELEAYLLKNKINTVKAPLGTYVEVIQAGTLPKIKKGNYIVVKYTGSLLNGKVFDSNVDPSFGHVDPLAFSIDVTPSQVIQGFEDGFKMFGKGGKGKLFVPSFLGYGAQGNGDILPNSNMIFEVEVIDVFASAPTASSMYKKKGTKAKKKKR
jgi:FKBP-type peptidyl-prolyl cis-trans isomerase FkpA